MLLWREVPWNHPILLPVKPAWNNLSVNWTRLPPTVRKSPSRAGTTRLQLTRLPPILRMFPSWADVVNVTPTAHVHDTLRLPSLDLCRCKRHTFMLLWREVSCTSETPWKCHLTGRYGVQLSAGVDVTLRGVLERSIVQTAVPEPV